MPIHPTNHGDNSGSIPTLFERVEHIRCDIAEIKVLIVDHMKDSRERDEKTNKDLLLLSHKAESAHLRIDALDKFRAEVEKLLPFLKAEAWVIGALAVPFIVWIGALVVQWIRGVP